MCHPGWPSLQRWWIDPAAARRVAIVTAMGCGLGDGRSWWMVFGAATQG